MKMYAIVLGVVAAMAMGTAAFAEDGQGAKHHKFKEADTDGDQKLSLAEFTAGFARGNPEKRFVAADTDGDGFLTREELKAAHGKGKQCAGKDKPAE